MCLVVCAWNIHPTYPFIFAGNRDEFYQRPALPATWWEENPNVLAGKDVEGGGTWLGINRQGHVAVLTNYRNPKDIREAAPTRGVLPLDYLIGQSSAATYAQALGSNAELYNGFNMLVKDQQELWFMGNRDPRWAVPLTPGLYGLSNHLLDTAWPKVAKLKEGITQLIETHEHAFPIEEMFAILADRNQAPEDQLPQTGVSLSWEKILSPVFIESPTYGTRVSTLILIDRRGKVYFEERSYVPAGPSAIFEFDIIDP